MCKTRALEERLIKMAKSSDGHFWIGGPGEEAFNIPLGLLIQKGEGIGYDCLHFHYRNSGTMLAMGEEMVGSIRQMFSSELDPYSGGRNFVGHYSKKEWNVFPVTSPIETQYVIALGTARAQKVKKCEGITIVTGGDAGTAEGDFASCLGWSNIPGQELPLLILVTNNRYGISTPYDQAHGDKIIAKRAEAHGIEWDTVDGLNPEVCYKKISDVMKYVRKKRKPFCLEAYVSRLYGHSSSSGANLIEGERDPIEEYQKKLIDEKIFTQDECEKIKTDFETEAFEILKQVRLEPKPDGGTATRHTFA